MGSQWISYGFTSKSRGVEVIRAEQLISVLACVHGCRAYDIWKATFGQIEGDDMLFVSDEYNAVSDATMSQSFISLRRIDEFLSEKGKLFPTDLRYGDLSIDKAKILGSDRYVLSDSERTAINRFEAHLTKFGQADIDDLEALLSAVERTKDLLCRLDAELRRLIAEEPEE